MKIQNKIISILLIVAILSSFLPSIVSNAQADTNFTMSITGENKTQISKNIDEVFSVDLDYTNAVANKDTLGIMLEYDKNKLELICNSTDEDGQLILERTSIEEGEQEYSVFYDDVVDNIRKITLAAAAASPSKEDENKMQIIIAYKLNNESFKTNAKFARLKFKVKQEGTSQITYANINFAQGDEEGIRVNSNSKIAVTGEVPLNSINVSPKSKTINKGETATLTCTKTPENTTDTTNITWSSSNNNIVTVAQDGTITAKGAGTATITATCKTFSDTCEVTVKNPLQSISLNKQTATVHKGESLQLNCIKNPEDAVEEGQITWSSSNSEVATVSETGNVTALQKGTATITASLDGKTSTCNITVDAPIIGITEKVKNIALDVQETKKLEYIINPEEADETVIEEKWSYTNSNVIASVDNEGVVTGLKCGTTVINATIKTSANKTYNLSYNITVDAHLESISITNGDLELLKGQQQKLNISYNPETFSEEKTITWSSSTPEVAEIVNGTVVAKKEGTATITAKSVNNKVATITVTVKEIKIETLTINKGELNINNQEINIEKGNSETLTAKIMPENTTDEKTVIWESNKPECVTIDNNGKVTAIAPGKATITAKAGEKTATCIVNVTCELKSITINKTALTLDVGNKSQELVVTNNPVDATVGESKVSWSSNNTSVATVNNTTGEITAVSPGKATITATLNEKTATCVVTVTANLTAVTIEKDENKDNGNLNLKEGQSAKLRVIYTPINAVNVPKATWSSSNTSVAKVDNNGVVTAVSEGQAQIKVKYSNGIEDTRIVKVTKIPENTPTVNNVTEKISRNEKINLGLLNLAQNEKITWESSDTNIATIETNTGVVKGIKAGKVTLIGTISKNELEDNNENNESNEGNVNSNKVRNVDNKVEAQLEVVENHLKSIEIIPESNSMKAGKTMKANLKLYGEYTSFDVTDNIEIVSCTSSNESIATVTKNDDNTFTITALPKNGTNTFTISAQIKATKGDGTSNAPIAITSLPIEVKQNSFSGSGSSGTNTPSNPNNTQNNNSTNETIENTENNTVNNENSTNNNETVENTQNNITNNETTGNTQNNTINNETTGNTQNNIVDGNTNTENTNTQTDKNNNTNKQQDVSNIKDNNKNSSNKTTSKTPQTGDIDIYFIVTIMIISLIGMSITMYKIIKYKK